MPTVNSSLVRFIEYFPEEQILRVVFVSGSAYLYMGVPESVYTAFLHSSSKGQFFNNRIRDRYPSQKVR